MTTAFNWSGTLVPRQGEDSEQSTVQGWADLEPAGCPLPALSKHWASDIQPESPPLSRLPQCPGFSRGFLYNTKRQGPVRCQTREIALPCFSKERKASAVPGQLPLSQTGLQFCLPSKGYLDQNLHELEGRELWIMRLKKAWLVQGQRGQGQTLVSFSRSLSSGQHKDRQGNH